MSYVIMNFHCKISYLLLYYRIKKTVEYLVK